MTAVADSNAGPNAYALEVQRLREAGVVGQSGRLRDLFDFMADRGENSPPATQADLAAEVFGQFEPDADDATVRVYVHRLRKKLDDFYLSNPPAPGEGRLDIPAGVYALQFQIEAAPVVPSTASAMQPGLIALKPWVLALLVLAPLIVVAASVYFTDETTRPGNEIWAPTLQSERPTLVVLGDYYIYGEIDPVRPEEGRLIRDFRVNSAEDLLRMQEADPDRYAYAEDMGLNYLPFSSSYALEEIVPMLAVNGKDVSVIAASELEADMLNYFDIVYLGLLSGMHLLEDISFPESGFVIGDSYDEIILRETGQIWTSEEARSLASPAFYRDYAYVAHFRSPSGALVTVLASQRDTGLRGISPIIAGADIPDDLIETIDENDNFEALFQITGQQGADLSERLILARGRE